jgi:hypothetical protein
VGVGLWRTQIARKWGLQRTYIVDGMLPLLRDNEGKKLQKKPLVGAEEE